MMFPVAALAPKFEAVANREDEISIYEKSAEFSLKTRDSSSLGSLDCDSSSM